MCQYTGLVLARKIEWSIFLSSRPIVFIVTAYVGPCLDTSLLAPRLLERCCAEYVKTPGDLLLINHSQSLDIISCVSQIGPPCLNRQNTMDQRWPNDKPASKTLAQYRAIVVISCFLGNIIKNHRDKSIRYLWWHTREIRIVSSSLYGLIVIGIRKWAHAPKDVLVKSSVCLKSTKREVNHSLFNPLTAKSFNLNYSDLTKMEVNCFQILPIDVTFYLWHV